jgi:hypothetical protein
MNRWSRGGGGARQSHQCEVIVPAESVFGRLIPAAPFLRDESVESSPDLAEKGQDLGDGRNGRELCQDHSPSNERHRGPLATCIAEMSCRAVSRSHTCFCDEHLSWHLGNCGGGAVQVTSPLLRRDMRRTLTSPAENMSELFWEQSHENSTVAQIPSASRWPSSSARKDARSTTCCQIGDAGMYLYNPGFIAT